MVLILPCAWGFAFTKHPLVTRVHDNFSKKVAHSQKQNKSRQWSRTGPNPVRPSTHLYSVLSAVPQNAWTAFLPPFLGLIKNDYTVSYGYGWGVSLTAFSIWSQSLGANGITTLHAAALMFYGLRLNLFLFVRGKISSRIKEINDRIESRALERGNRFKTRIPFIVSCGFLYYGLAAPLLFTSKLANLSAVSKSFLQMVLGLQWVGFLMAAIGDLTKTYVKQSEKDEKFLVTSGIFSLVRHPNYTGEIIGWTANAISGLFGAVALLRNAVSIQAFGNLAAMLLGWIGIVFVLLGATRGLEDRQLEMYGTDDKYQEWVSTSWGGWAMPSKQNDSKTSKKNTEYGISAPTNDDDYEEGEGI